jgi:hypothetical protein
MRKTVVLTHAVAIGVLFSGLSAVFGVVAASAKENPANDCLVGIEGPGPTPDVSVNITNLTVSCTDGDSCDDDGQTNGSCSFKIKGCVNIPNVSGCTPRPIKKVKFKTGNEKNLISLTPDATNPSSVCGSFVDFKVALKKKGKKKPPKAGKRKLIAMATANQKPFGKNKDTDKITFMCNPCPTDSCVPPTTTTTVVVTTSTTTTTAPAEPFCGDGIVNGSEGCDPAAANTGCTGGQTCMPAGAISECTCKTCAPINPVQVMQFTTATGTEFCGSGALVDPPATTPPNPPGSGSVMGGSTTIPLGSGCLYIGGGNANVPGGGIPDGSTSNFNLTLDCGGELVVAGKAPTNDAETRSCTTGVGATHACANTLELWPNLTACTTDDDCPHTGQGGAVAKGSCIEKPNCLFGPPLPIIGAPSTCVVNTIGETASGSVLADGSAQVTLPLRSHTFISLNTNQPCPICNNNLCEGGPRDGMACTTTSVVQQTSIDCPPDPAMGAYLPEFVVRLDKLTTGSITKTNAQGLFCPSQNTASAFGTQQQAPPLVVTSITETGSKAAGALSTTPQDVTLSTVFCIPATADALINGAADLPGPGAVSLPGTLQILP